MTVAAISGKLPNLKWLHEVKGVPVILDSSGFSPLMSACEEGALDVAKYLVSIGGDPHYRAPVCPPLISGMLCITSCWFRA